MPPKLDEIGAWGAGYQAPDAINHGDAEAEPHLHQLIRWGESLARQKKKFFLDNLRRPALVRRAAEAGASFLTSDAFWPCVTWPGGVISMAAPDQSPFSQPQKTLSSA